MPRARNPDRERAYEIYQESQGKIDLVEIASQLNISAGTVRGWKSKDKWDSRMKGTFQKNTERSKRSKGGQPGNKNATGPPENKNAEKHGLFAKYLPADTLDIINHMSLSPLDILWDQIQVAYAAIIRAQSIMHVTDKAEMIKELKKRKSHSSEKSKSLEEEWNFQFAWDRQAQFMKAQARAQAELRSLIRQYDNMLHKNWDMATEEQRSRIDLVRAQSEKIQKDLEKEEEQPIQVTFRRASEVIAGNSEDHGAE